MAHIFIADDSPDVAHLVGAILKREGHSYESFSNGQRLIERFSDGSQCDLVITDLLMPELDGLGVLRYMGAHIPDTPVLVMSGGGVTIDASCALKSVAQIAAGVLEKPIDYDVLITKVSLLTSDSSPPHAVGDKRVLPSGSSL